MTAARGRLLCLGLLFAGACAADPEGAITTGAITAGTIDDADPSVVALIGAAGVMCSGSLVGDRVVLTAAHCLATLTPRTTVFFGADPAIGGTTLHVLDAHPHPDFDPLTYDNDVALLLLDGAPPAGAQPLELFAGPMDDSYTGRPIRLVGFGKQAPDDPAPLRKRTGTSIIDQVYPADFVYHANPSQTCSGDSGGPAFVTDGAREVIVGVTSNGDPTCAVSAVDARVDVHLTDFVAPYLAATAPRAAGAGERCYYEESCVVGSCRFPADAPRIGYCASPCSAGTGCPERMRCGSDNVCAYPPPSPGALGAPCTLAGECDSQTCSLAEAGGDATCSVSCYPNAIACPTAMDCVPLANDPAKFGCFPEQAGGCGCTADGGGSTAIFGALVMLLLSQGQRRWTAGALRPRLRRVLRRHRALRSWIAK